MTVLPGLMLGTLGLGVYDLARPHQVVIQKVYVAPGATPAQVAKAHIVDSAAADEVSITSIVCKTVSQDQFHAAVDCRVQSSQGSAHLTIDEVQSTWHLTSSQFS